MKRSTISFFSMLLALVMVAGSLASCSGAQNSEGASTQAPVTSSEETTAATEEATTLSDTTLETNDVSAETSATTSTDASESETAVESSEAGSATEGIGNETENSDTSESEAPSDTEPESPKLSGEHAELIENAEALKNGVTAYYGDGSRNSVSFENGEMSLNYTLASDKSQVVTSLTNKNGNSYIANTMDVFVRMTDGDTYFASSSSANAIFNIHRFGYYFYQMRLEGQNFIGELAADSALEVNIQKPSSTYDIQYAKFKGDHLTVKNTTPSVDSHLVYAGLSVDTSKYTILEVSIKADETASSAADLFYVAGDATGFSGERRVRFTLTTDGLWHTYHVPVYTGPDYVGTLSAIRLDISGAGAEYEIKDVKFLEIDMGGVPSELSLCRTFNVYSDKMYQVIQIAATKETAGIKEVGMLTTINADTVAKVVVKDKDGIRYTFDGADWASVEYVAFDIIDSGIFGYILPYDGKGGSISVTLLDGVYYVEQTMAPANGTIIPSRTDYNSDRNYYNWVEGGNTNDLFMGQRIYTDGTHSFDTFLEEAYCERNPLSASYIRINESGSTQSSYAGYDSLRGIYVFNIDGATGFSAPYYTSPNKYYRSNFIIRGDDHDRKIYAMTYCKQGQLECAVLLDSDDVLLPVPMEVGKNFSEAGGERNLYNLADFTYSETIFPLVINAKDKYEYTVLNLYQNWGNYPLKQISWIQFFSPYYHLSTGVTETNCIVPWTFTNQIWYNTLPDFRGMSAPLWKDQPQHTSAGDHDWLKYTDSEGNEVRAENILNTIDSYGPTYADVKMDYITYDGKIRVSYTHTEMPQTDENRTYYEIKYEVMEDVTINDVVKNLQLYRVEPNDAGKYKRVGYLNTSGESVVVAANETATPVKYTLGTECPYFSFFDMDGHTNSTGYGNLAFLIYNSSFTVGGETITPNFAIVNHTDCVYVTLDLETLTLKAGDSITINCILLPWGSELLDDGIIDPENNNFEYTMELDGGTLYMDKNVRDVRANTLLAPLYAKADKDCEVIESVYVPKLMSTNGESAEFTLGGGYNNVAVRIYGFNKMTVPVIYEKIDGEWVVYNVSSSEKEKDPHYFDGYMIHYDGDGTFSYSFVTDMDGKNERSFKIVADGNYKSWSKESKEEVLTRPDKLNVYADSVELAANTDTLLSMEFVSKSEVAEDESYVRFYGPGLDAKYAESYITAYKASEPIPESGKYLAVKYRLGKDNPETVKRFDFFLSTTAGGASENNVIYISNVKSDGEWHTLIIDLEKVQAEAFADHFVADADGKYCIKFIRFDFFDRRMSEESYIDIAFVGVDNSLAKIAELSQDCKTITLLEGSSTAEVDPTTGEKIDLTVHIPEVLVDPSSGYTQADLEYGCQIDKLNGARIDIQGGSKKGVVGILHNASTIADYGVTDSATVAGHNLVLGGWCVIEGGIDSHVWSADGGVTWHTLTGYGRVAGAPDSAIIEASYARSNKTYQFTMAADGAKGSFQGAEGKNPTGLCIDLEEYTGQTVNIILGVVPAKDTSTILPIYYIAKVKVAQ